MDQSAGPNRNVRASDFLLLAFFVGSGVLAWGVVSAALGSPSAPSILAIALGGTMFLASAVVLIRGLIRMSAGDVITGDPARDRYATESGPVATPYVAVLAFFAAFGVLMVALARISDGDAAWWGPVGGGACAVALGSVAFVIARLAADRRLAEQNEPFIRQQAEEELKAELGDDYDEFVRSGPGSH